MCSEAEFRELNPMDLSHFDLRSVAFEVRYDQAYLLWDRAGALWQAVHRIAPTIKLTESVPAKISGFIERRFHVSVELEKVLIIVYPPPSTVEDYIALCRDILAAAIDILGVKIYSRIGLRLIHHRRFRSSEEAADALLSTGIMKVPEGKHFGIEGPPKLPHYAIRLDGDNLAVQVNLHTQERKLKIDVPLGETALESVEKDIFELIYDVDYFTIGTVDIGQFRASDWIPNALRVIRRDSKVFLGG
jgi:hypothetical protein